MTHMPKPDKSGTQTKAETAKPEPVVATPVAIDAPAAVPVPTPAPAAAPTEAVPSPYFPKRRIIFRPQGMAYRLTYTCVIGCRHCYQKAEFQSNEVIEKDTVLAKIREGKEAGFKNVGFSGGEPMLCSETVFEGIELAKKELGYEGSIGLQTNGFWGKTPKSAKTVIQKMAKAGFAPPLGKINLSVGEFHQEWIPMTTISNIISAYWEEFKHPILLNVTFSKGNKAVFQKLCDHLTSCGIPEEAYEPIIYPAIAQIGRANEVMTEDTNPARPISTFKECSAINKFTVEPTGNVAPCCGFNRFIYGICVGNVYEDSISEIFENANTNLIYQYIKYQPQHETHRLLSEKFKLRTHYRHKCEVCLDLFGKEEHVAYLEGIAETALAGELNPGSKKQSTRYFNMKKTATELSTMPDKELRRRMKVLEEENVQLQHAIANNKKLAI